MRKKNKKVKKVEDKRIVEENVEEKATCGRGLVTKHEGGLWTERRQTLPKNINQIFPFIGNLGNYSNFHFCCPRLSLNGFF